MNIFNRLNQLTDLTQSEKTLVEYMQNEPDNFVKYNAARIAKECFISTSTIYRLCSKLGLSGLGELKILVSSSIDEYRRQQSTIDYNFPIRSNEIHSQIVSKMRDLYDQTLLNTQNLVDHRQLLKIADALKKARHIDFYTSAGNIYFAQNFMFQMAEIGINVNVPLEEYQQRLAAANSKKDGIAIIMSFEGRGEIIGHIARTLKQNHTPIILISSTNANPLSKYANYPLYLSSQESHYHKISSFSTRLSLLFLLDCIYVYYFEKGYENNVVKKLDNYRKLKIKNPD